MMSTRKRRWPAALAFSALVLVSIGAFAFFFWPQIYSLLEEELIYRQKAHNWKT